MTLPLSILDLSPVGTGFSQRQALLNTLDLARLADQLGYKRYWLAEHHNMASIASSAPEILIGLVARETERIRVGAGGIMLPNHAPLKVVESFRLLEALFPGRIDLGIGRAPGTDPVTALALRGIHTSGAEQFPSLFADLIAFADHSFPADHPFRAIRPMPSEAPLPPIWLLGSSGYGAQFAAAAGVGYAHAHHINPHAAVEAARMYREQFRPSRRLDKPQTLLTVSVICAPTADEAEHLARSLDLLWVQLRSGRPVSPIATPEAASVYPYTPQERARMGTHRERQFVGTPEQVRAGIEQLAAATAADEVMVTTIVHDHAARRRSYELLADAFGLT